MALPDLTRELTGRGRKQASRMADWLNPRLPPDIRDSGEPRDPRPANRAGAGARI